MSAVSYYRISTSQQKASGLGLEAQRESVLAYVDREGLDLRSEFVEVETGRCSNRPQLKKALDACKRQGAVLIIAKLDRLARSVHFVSGLMESGIDFVAVDNPHANKLTIHILAAMAEYERDQISRRTKEALKAAKARGVRLGNPKNLPQAGIVGRGVLVSQAHNFAKNLEPVLASIERAGITTLSGMAQALNARGVPTSRGGKWYPTTVSNVLGRLRQSGSHEVE